jgi:hypothetical protein
VVTNFEINKMYYKIYMLCKNICIFIATISTMLGFIASAFSQFCFVEELLSKVSAVRCGAENLVGMSKQQYVDRLTWLKQLMRFNLLNWHDRKNFERVSQILETLKLDDSNGSIRKQPYCILLTGYPGCGKSNYALKLATACLRAKYGKAYPHDIVTLNETDEFQSEFRTSHKVVIFDDLGAENPNLNTKNPWRKVIDFVNNIRKTSLNPNVEMKGNIYIEPDLVIITTNLGGTFDTQTYCQAPSAVYRRLRKILFLEEGFIDARTILVDQPNNCKQLENVRVFDSRASKWKVGEIISRTLLQNEVVEDFLLFDEQQKQFVNETNSILDKVEDKNVFRSFYDDMIRPLTPSVHNFPLFVEEQLPWYQRLYRSLCQKEDMPICMSGSLCYSTDSFEILEPQGGFEKDEEYDEKLVDFLYHRIDWKFFELVQHKFYSTEFEIFDGVILDNSYAWCWKSTRPSDLTRGIDCKEHHLQLAYYKYKARQVLEEDVDNISEEELRVNMIWHYLYRKSKDVMLVDDNQKIVAWMNQELERSALGQLESKDTMAMVQYVVAIRACKRKFRCLGVEYSLYGYKPDVVLRSGNVTIVVECKNTKNTMGKRQVENYLRSLQDDGIPALGILFSQREIKFYALEPIPNSVIGNAKELVFDVLSELQRRSVQFGTNHFSTIDRCGAVGPIGLSDELSTNSPKGNS